MNFELSRTFPEASDERPVTGSWTQPLAAIRIADLWWLYADDHSNLSSSTLRDMKAQCQLVANWTAKERLGELQGHDVLAIAGQFKEYGMSRAYRSQQMQKLGDMLQTVWSAADSDEFSSQMAECTCVAWAMGEEALPFMPAAKRAPAPLGEGELLHAERSRTLWRRVASS